MDFKNSSATNADQQQAAPKHQQHHEFFAGAKLSFIDNSSSTPSDHRQLEEVEDEMTDVDEDEDYKKCDCVYTETQSYIPFKTIYEPLDDDSSSETKYFIPGEPVVATIVSARRDTDHVINIFSQYLYTIKLEHRGQTWTIERKYADFQRLANRLALFRATQRVTGPFIRGGTVHEEEEHEQPRTCTVLKLDEEDGLITDEQRFAHPSAAKHFFSALNFDDPVEQQNRAALKTFGRAIRAAANGAGAPSSGDQLTGNVAAPKTPATQTPDSTAKSGPLKAHRWPKLHFKPEAWFGAENVPLRRVELQKYVSAVLHFPALRNHKETALFFEVSRLSFVYNLEHKWKEGSAVKKPGGHLGLTTCNFKNCRRNCGYKCNCMKWYNRWFVVKDTFLAYLHPGTELVREVMLFDTAFDTKLTEVHGQRMSHGVLISNSNRELLMQCKSESEAKHWKEGIDRAVSANLGAEWKFYHPFGSAYPKRPDSYAHWLVDGKSFMEQVAHAMEYAREEIFIGGWFITAELYMKRPPKKRDPWQLCEILKRKAEQGVHCCVLFYKEFEKIIDNGSSYAKRVLKSLHPKIIVARHPDHTPPVLWAHHEKIVIIDQSIGFAGGIDLSYGRWDDYHHRLTDGTRAFKCQKPYYESAKEEPQKLTLAGCRSPNIRVRSDHGKSIVSIDVEPLPQQPSKFESIDLEQINVTDIERPQQAVVDQSAPQVAELDKLMAFIESGKRQKIRSRLDTPPKHTMDKLKRAVSEWRRKTPSNDPKHWYKEYENMIADIDALKDLCLDVANGEIWVGKDYTNWYRAYVTGYELPYCDTFDRKTVDRTPWHDVSCVVYGAAARDLARHFIQRWNACKEEKLNDNDKIPFLVPKSYVNISIPEYFRSASFPCIAQVLRSVHKWSAGVNVVEDSIHRAYHELIERAQHFVYIENQFFVTLLNHAYVRNMVATALYNRIVRAHRNQETFRVYVVLPLLPAFEGDLGETSGIPLQVMLHHLYSSINRSKEALLVNLEREVGDCGRYIQFYSLRTHAELSGKLITDPVYVHTKAMIVDDRYSIIGSANINDRSFAGDRDSEVAFYVEDTEFVASEMGGRIYEAGKFGLSFRKRLMGEHLGILDEQERIACELPGLDLNDPVSEQFWFKFKQLAAKNTQIYDEVFKCFPSDNIKTWEDLKRYKAEAQQSTPAVLARRKAEQLINEIQGFLVEFPTKFLENSVLQPDKGFMPDAWQYPFT